MSQKDKNEQNSQCYQRNFFESTNEDRNSKLNENSS